MGIVLRFSGKYTIKFDGFYAKALALAFRRAENYRRAIAVDAAGFDCDGAFLSATPELFAVFLLTSLSLPISANISSILNLSLNRNSTPLTVAYHIVFPSIKITINFTTFPCLLQCAIATKKKLQKVLSYTDYVPARLYSGSLFFQPYHCFTGYKSEQNRFQCIKESDGHKAEPFKALCPYFEFVASHRKRNTPC